MVRMMAEENNEKKTRKAKKEEAKIEELEQKLIQANEEIEAWKNKYYLAYADTQNMRKQYDKDHQQLIKYRAMGFIEKLLPILDGFHMALANEVTDSTLKNYLIGFEYIYKMMIDALESEGVKEISPKIGDKFDETIMDAVDTEESDQEENIVLRIYQKGYQLKDRMVRHARVVVSKKPSSNEELKEENENDKESTLDETKDA